MRVTASIALGLLLLIFAAPQTRAQECDKQYDSTFAAIEDAIFGGHGCTSVTCHSGPLPAGELDLSPGMAYDNLLDQPVRSISTDGRAGLRRLVPGNKANSLLWLNLAAAALPEEWSAPLRPMPIGFPPLTFDEIELVREWIEHGATREGVVPGTENLVDACFTPSKPLKVVPLTPPAPDEGVQVRAPQQVLPPTSERETCFVSYYDFTGKIPAESLSPDGKSFRYKRIEPRQDPLSHHAVVIVYNGKADIHDPVWGPFTCHGGDQEGETCDPVVQGVCGDDGVCGSVPRQAVACTGYGPGDASIGVGDTSLFSTMASNAAEQEGVFAEAPVKAMLVWNSHAFNVFDEPALLDIWLNIEFAKPEEQQHQLHRFVNVASITKMRPPAYGADQVCAYHVLPDGARVLDLSSHTHKRGKRFRIFAGRFSCSGGPNDGNACTPLGPDSDFPVGDLCAGAPCEGRVPPEIGDCNGDLRVAISELVSGVRQALGTASTPCPAFDPEGDGVRVADLVRAVRAALFPETVDGADSLIYTTLSYADPLVLQFTPSHLFAAPGASAGARTLTYCALYDNGFSDPAEVKRSSLVPTNGSPCRATHCAEGNVGAPCSGGTPDERDTSCDSAAGTGDGFCDACSAGFGVTTDDEMFVLAGSYYFSDR